MKDEKDTYIIIKSGNNNKSIGSYVNRACATLINTGKVELKAYGNNMNKLITIEEIIKRGLMEKAKIEIKIGKDKMINNNCLEFIAIIIVIDKNNSDIIKMLHELTNNKNNKRKVNVIKTENDVEIENNFNQPNEKEKEEEIIDNINSFFM